MLTLTIRHHAALPLRESLQVLKKAWRQVRKSGTVARAWTEHVRATVRAVEITHGSNGWHPHLHVLVRLAGDHIPVALLEIEDAWSIAVARAGGEAYVPAPGVGVRWSAPREAEADVAARYAAKLGWEATGSGKPSERSPWAILERAARGDAVARSLWEEYVAATRGCRAIELDDRAAKAACRARTLRGSDHICEETEQQQGSTNECELVEREHISLLRRYEAVVPAALDLVLRDAEEIGAKRALKLWLGLAEAWERQRFRRAA